MGLASRTLFFLVLLAAAWAAPTSVDAPQAGKTARLDLQSLLPPGVAAAAAPSTTSPVKHPPPPTPEKEEGAKPSTESLLPPGVHAAAAQSTTSPVKTAPPPSPTPDKEEGAKPSTASPVKLVLSPAVAPAQAPSPSKHEKEEEGCDWKHWWRCIGFLFATMGMVDKLIGWVVFDEMTEEEWGTQQCDAFSEYNILIDIAASALTLFLHMWWLEKMNLDTAMAELIGLFSGLQQLRYVIERKMEADFRYKERKHMRFWQKALPWSFWALILLLVGFFATVEYRGVIPDKAQYQWVGAMLAVFAIVLKIAQLVCPFVTRCATNSWKEDAKAAKRWKIAAAATATAAGIYDCCTYHFKDKYQDKRLGNQFALYLAYASTVSAAVLLLLRVFGSPAGAKQVKIWGIRMWNRLKGREDVPEPYEDPEQQTPPWESVRTSHKPLLYMLAEQRRRLKGLERRLKKRNEDCTVLMAELAEVKTRLKSQNISHGTKVRHLEQRLVTSAQENDRLQEDQQHIEDAKQTLEHTLDQVKQQLFTEKQTNTSVHKELTSSLQTEIAQKEELQQLNETQAKKIDELTSSLQTANAEKDVLQQQNDAHAQQMDELKATLQAAIEENQAHQTEDILNRQQVAHLNHKIAKLKLELQLATGGRANCIR